MWIKSNLMLKLRNAASLIIDRSLMDTTSCALLNRTIFRHKTIWQHRYLSKSSLDPNRNKQSVTTGDETKQLNEDDWFKKILKPTEIQNNMWNSGPMLTKRFSELSPDEKREYILSYYEASKERGDSVPKKLTDESMDLLMRTESLIHFKKTLV